VSVAAGIVNRVHEWNVSDDVLGSMGVVLGATVQLDAYGITGNSLASTPILAPGFGHQGAQFVDISTIYGNAAGNVLVSASRSILAAGPDEIAWAISAQSAEVAGALAA
jgi:orotidine-5'-phosphate decarboxylase